MKSSIRAQRRMEHLFGIDKVSNALVIILKIIANVNKNGLMFLVL